MMSALDDAIARLEAAVARLDQASQSGGNAVGEEQLLAIAARIDAALARLGELLERED